MRNNPEKYKINKYLLLKQKQSVCRKQDMEEWNGKAAIRSYNGAAIWYRRKLLGEETLRANSLGVNSRVF